MLGRYPAVSAAHDAASLCFVLLGMWHALSGRATDLLEERRRFRVEFAVSTALYIALIIASQWLWPGTIAAVPFSLANAIGLVALIFLLVLRSPRLAGEQRAANSSPNRQTAGDDPPAALQPTEQDVTLLDALRKLMDQDKAYRGEGLSIASLSQSLGVPEYRLRRLINRQLGHRNFSTFVNGYRLAEAVAALADPSQADVPILTIALDAGFGSIGPFNRAFKAHTGLTPTEYRRARLGGSEERGQSPISKSATDF
jgi:AraC-like DNA-binding protein